MTEIISRADARSIGSKYYYTGIPCKHGHRVRRKVSNRACCECHDVYWKKYYQSFDADRKKKENTRKRAQEKKYPERVIAYREKNKEKNKLRMKKYNGRYRERQKYYRENNKEIVNKRTKEWRESNPDKNRTYLNNRRALLKNAGKHTAKDIIEILNKQKRKCIYCNCKLKTYHVDHVFPLSRGGSNEKHNLQLLCPPCNLKKNAKLPEVWAQEMGMLI